MDRRTGEREVDPIESYQMVTNQLASSPFSLSPTPLSAKLRIAAGELHLAAPADSTPYRFALALSLIDRHHQKVVSFWVCLSIALITTYPHTSGDTGQKQR